MVLEAFVSLVEREAEALVALLSHEKAMVFQTELGFNDRAELVFSPSAASLEQACMQGGRCMQVSRAVVWCNLPGVDVPVSCSVHLKLLAPATAWL